MGKSGGPPVFIRKWQVFPGRNRFYCGGRLMTAPNSGVFLLTVFLISGTTALFFIFDCKYLAHNVTIAIPIVGALLFMFTMSSLLRTSLSDPGIIPRATAEEAAYVERQIEVTNSANSPTYRPPPRTKEVMVKGQTVKLKYCFTCKIFRPPRASHCSLCDNCVDRFDHHCPWVGNCVGRRNYRFFYMFIVSLSFLSVFIFACSVAHLILITRDSDGREMLEAIRESPASLVVAVICFFSVWTILALAGFHTYLTTSNQTTNEDIKGSFTTKRGQENFNPYSKGNICANCLYILCGPVTPSLLDPRGIVTDEYSREMQMPYNYQTDHTYEQQPQPQPYLVHSSANASGMQPYAQQHQQQTRTVNSKFEQNFSMQPPSLSSRYSSTDTAAEDGVTTAPNVVSSSPPVDESNVGSVTHLVSNEQPISVMAPLHHQRATHLPLAVAPTDHCLGRNHQLEPNERPLATKTQSHMHRLDIINPDRNNSPSPKTLQFASITADDDLHLDAIVLTDHITRNLPMCTNMVDTRAGGSGATDLFSATRLKMLQDTTMIESALDLDSLDETSIGGTSGGGGGGGSSSGGAEFLRITV